MTPLNLFFFSILPYAFLMLQIVLEIILPETAVSVMNSEGGTNEIIQIFIMFAATMVCFMTLKEKPWTLSIWLGVWVAIATLSCIYVTGEELSWGQHLLHWDASDYWKTVNDQGETNLHNTSSWLDQKPRILLEIGVLVGGIILPLLKRYKPSIIPAKFSIIIPDERFMMIAVCAVLFKIFGDVMLRSSEIIEIYLYYFVLIYMLVLRPRIAERRKMS